MVRTLSTLIPADAGTASVMGHDLRREAGVVRAVIGVTGQFSAVDNLLTGEENLFLMGRLLHLRATERRARTARLLERFDLVEAARPIPATYSGGMKRRLDIAMTLMGRPRLIFLDEPTTGLDPRSRHTVWQLVRDLVAEGVTILLTTQYLEEADQLADRIALLDRGHIVAEGTPEELKRRMSRPAAGARREPAYSADGARRLDPDAVGLTEGSRHLDGRQGRRAQRSGVPCHLPRVRRGVRLVPGRPAPLPAGRSQPAVDRQAAGQARGRRTVRRRPDPRPTGRDIGRRLVAGLGPAYRDRRGA